MKLNPYSISLNYHQAQSIAKSVNAYMKGHEWMRTEQIANWALLQEVLIVFSSPEWEVWKYRRQAKSGKHSNRTIKLRRSEAMLLQELNDWEELHFMPYERSIVSMVANSIHYQKINIVERDDILNRSMDFDLEGFVKEQKIKLHDEQ